MQHGRLIVVFVPLADELVGPDGVFVRVADIAGVGRFEGRCRSRRGRQHRMVAAAHPREFRHGHVAADAPRAGAFGRVMGMGSDVLHHLLVARQTRPIGVVLVAIAPAGRVAMDAVELAALDARAHPPCGIGIVLAQVAAVGIEVGVLQAH